MRYMRDTHLKGVTLVTLSVAPNPRRSGVTGVTSEAGAGVERREKGAIAPGSGNSVSNRA